MKKEVKIIIYILISLSFVTLLLIRGGDEVYKKKEPVRLEDVGNGLKLIEIDPRAAERIGVETYSVETVYDGDIIPETAIIYDIHGDTWVYIEKEPLTFIRMKVSVNYINEGIVFLLKRVPLNTKIVTIGVMELYGSESGVGKGY